MNWTRVVPAVPLLATLLAVVGCALPLVAPDVKERAAQFASKDMSQSRLAAGLVDWERAVLDKLMQAANAMDAVYWQQVDPDGKQIFRRLARAPGLENRAAAFLMDANYGRWDRFREYAPFVGTDPHPPGSYVYPADLTKAELDAYLAAHPEEKDALLSPFTVIRRHHDRLVAVPYHVAYAKYVLPAAQRLDEAAKLSQNASLTKYLQLQAEALRTDEYFEANLAWLDLDSNLDLSIGPHETYDDMLTGQKAFYKANVLIVDRAAAARLAKLEAAAPAFQANLPVDPKYKPDQTGTMTPLVVADDIARTGQSRAIMEAVAFSLPNDPKVWEAKGAKQVMMGNYLAARRSTVLLPLAQAILDPAVFAAMDPDTYFTWVLMHEISHTLGPRTVTKDGTEMTVGETLGEYYSPIEEAKADIAGLYNASYLVQQGLATGPLVSYYAGYLSEALRSIRFGMGSAYGLARSAAWNVFLDQGALKLDASAERFVVDVDRMTAAIRELLVQLLVIEGEGDTQAAAAYLGTYANVRPELKALLDKTATTVPIEFVPVRTTAVKR